MMWGCSCPGKWGNEFTSIASGPWEGTQGLFTSSYDRAIEKTCTLDMWGQSSACVLIWVRFQDCVHQIDTWTYSAS